MVGSTTKQHDTMDVHVQVKDSGVAVVTLIHPPVNALHPKLLAMLFRKIEQLHANEQVRAIVLRGKGGIFSAGFDVSNFQQDQKKGNGRKNGPTMDAGNLQKEIEDTLENGKVPVVALVAGMALGGGLELAMACAARIAVKGAKLGLPELQLGILPGFGGTQRMPRLAGLNTAIQAMLTSKPLTCQESHTVGLVDKVCKDEQEALRMAEELAIQIANGKAARCSALYRNDRLPPIQEALPILDAARKMPAARMPHAQLCLDAIETGLLHGAREGLKKESLAFSQARSLPVHHALVHFFFAERGTKKLTLMANKGSPALQQYHPKNIQVVGVIGGGLMGAGITTALVVSGIRVLLKEVNDQALQAGIKRVHANIESMKRKASNQGRARASLEGAKENLVGVKDFEMFKDCDMVIEAVIENLELKQAIFADFEKACRKDCILATNTSTIDLQLIGKKCSATTRKRILGAHFFSPAQIMKLLEIVKTQETDGQYVQDTIALSSKIKKVPIVVGNCTGFAVNRVFFPYTMAGCLLVDMGLDPYMMDKAIAGFGMPMGPFRLADLVGIDIGLHVGKNFVDSFPERVYISTLLQHMHESGRLGEKSGRGFYKYDLKLSSRKALPDVAGVTKILQRSRKDSGIPEQKMKNLKLSPEAIVEMIFFPIVNEACRVISEGIVDKPSDIDAASVLAMGFPPYRGGLIWWADHEKGSKYIHKRLEELASEFPLQSGFFKPCEYLQICAKKGLEIGAGLQIGPKL